MISNFPCKKCGQSQGEYNHLTEQIILAREDLAREYCRLALYDAYRDQLYANGVLLHEARKRGYDNHNYDPVDNLTYLEMLSDNRSSL